VLPCATVEHKVKHTVTSLWDLGFGKVTDPRAGPSHHPNSGPMMSFADSWCNVVPLLECCFVKPGESVPEA